MTFPVYTVSREPGDESNPAPGYQHGSFFSSLILEPPVLTTFTANLAALPTSSLPPAKNNSFGKDAGKNLVGHPYQDVSMKNLHPVLFQLEEGEDLWGAIAVDWEEDENENLVVTTQGRFLRKICDLPRYVTRDMSGLHIELLCRLDSRLVPNDLIDRMDEDVFDTGKKQPASNAINMRRSRFRDLLGMKSWKPGRTWPCKTDIEVLDSLTAAQINANTTMVIDNGRLWQPVFNKQNVVVHHADSGLPLDYFLQARTSDVPSHFMLNTAALRCRVQTVAMLHNHGFAPDNWKAFGIEKDVPQENKNLPYWYNDSNAGNRGTGDVASKRGGKKFADTLKEKERKIVELDNLRHSEFMEAYVANNPADTIQVAKRAKGNQVKGDAARSARYQKNRTVAELKGNETLSAVSGTDAVHHGLENEHQYPMAQPLLYNSSQDWSGMTLTGGGQNTSYTPRLPPPTPAEEQAFADSLRMLKKRRTEDNNAEAFGIVRPDSDRSFGQVGSKFQDAKRRKTRQPLGEVGVKRGARDYFDDDEEPSSRIQSSTMNSDSTTVTSQRKIKAHRTCLVRPPKGGALTIESGFPQPFRNRNDGWSPQSFISQLTEGYFSHPQTVTSHASQSTGAEGPTFEPRGREKSAQPVPVMYEIQPMQADSGYGSQTPSGPSLYSTPANVENDDVFENFTTGLVGDGQSPPKVNGSADSVEVDNTSAGIASKIGSATQDQDNLVSHAVGGQEAQPDSSNDALWTDLVDVDAGEIDLREYDVGELDSGDGNSTQPEAREQDSVPQPEAVTEASIPQPVNAGSATEASQAPASFIYPNVMSRVYAAQSSLDAHCQLANDAAAAAIEQQKLRDDYVDPESMSAVWQFNYGHFLGESCTQAQAKQYLDTRH